MVLNRIPQEKKVRFVGYEYDDELYETSNGVDEAICEKIGENYNNIDPMDTSEFEDEWYWVEEVWQDENGVLYSEYAIEHGER